MNCPTCHNPLQQDNYCICTKCRTKMCPRCAEKQGYVCDCGGDIAYLS